MQHTFETNRDVVSKLFERRLRSAVKFQRARNDCTINALEQELVDLNPDTNAEARPSTSSSENPQHQLDVHESQLKADDALMANYENADDETYSLGLSTMERPEIIRYVEVLCLVRDQTTAEQIRTYVINADQVVPERISDETRELFAARRADAQRCVDSLLLWDEDASFNNTYLAKVRLAKVGMTNRHMPQSLGHSHMDPSTVFTLSKVTEPQSTYQMYMSREGWSEARFTEWQATVSNPKWREISEKWAAQEDAERQAKEERAATDEPS